MTIFRFVLPAVAVIGLAVASPAHADPGGIKVGTLSCDVEGGMGFVFGSSKNLRCSYAPTSAVAEHYSGKISKWGIDIGFTGKGKLVWAVFAPSTDVQPGALGGDY